MSALNKIPSAIYLNSVFRYEDGRLVGKLRPLDHFPNTRAMNIWNAKYAGRPLGRSSGYKGYNQVMLDGSRLLVHRVIAAMHGIDVDGKLVDHIDGDIRNNKLENLRVCCHAENMRNNAGWSKKATRVGVRMSGQGKWQAYIRREGRAVHLGFFKTQDQAVAARRKAEREAFAEFSFSASRETEVAA